MSLISPGLPSWAAGGAAALCPQPGQQRRRRTGGNGIAASTSPALLLLLLALTPQLGSRSLWPPSLEGSDAPSRGKREGCNGRPHTLPSALLLGAELPSELGTSPVAPALWSPAEKAALPAAVRKERWQQHARPPCLCAAAGAALTSELGDPSVTTPHSMLRGAPSDLGPTTAAAALLLPRSKGSATACSGAEGRAEIPDQASLPPALLLALTLQLGVLPAWATRRPLRVCLDYRVLSTKVDFCRHNYTCVYIAAEFY